MSGEGEVCVAQSFLGAGSPCLPAGALGAGDAFEAASGIWVHSGTPDVEVWGQHA